MGEFESGTILKGRYRVLERLGEGSFGQTLKATDETLQRTVVVKISHRATDADDQERLKREAGVLARLAHPRIAGFIEVDTLEDGRTFLVMEYIDGDSLERLLEEGPLPADMALQIARGVAEAVQEAHDKGFLHRDLKPSNVMIPADGARLLTDQIKLVDFGLAGKLVGGENKTQTGQVYGTPRYMSPEQVKGDRQSPATDVYGLGTILFQMIFGRAPFDGDAVVRVLFRIVNEKPEFPRESSISARLTEFLQRCLEKNPADRPQSMAEVLTLIDAIPEAHAAPAKDPRGVEEITLVAAAPRLPGAPEGHSDGGSAPGPRGPTQLDECLEAEERTPKAPANKAQLTDPGPSATATGSMPRPPDLSAPRPTAAPSPRPARAGESVTRGSRSVLLWGALSVALLLAIAVLLWPLARSLRGTSRPNPIIDRPPVVDGRNPTPRSAPPSRALGIFTGVALAGLGIGLAFSVRQWISRIPSDTSQQAGALLMGLNDREALSRSLALEMGDLLAQCRGLEQGLLGASLAVTLKQYESAMDLDNQQKALMNALLLVEKLNDRLKPWYVKYEKALAFLVSLIGVITGILTIWQTFAGG